MFKLELNLLGHVFSKQDFVCLSIPLHPFPPFWGGGLVHDRFRVLVPVPHVLEHADHVAHNDQRPLTKGDSRQKRQCETVAKKFFLAKTDGEKHLESQVSIWGKTPQISKLSIFLNVCLYKNWNVACFFHWPSLSTVSAIPVKMS